MQRGTVSAERDNETTGEPAITEVWSDHGRGPDRLAIAAYLKSAHGFLVDSTSGAEVGVVDDVIVDPFTGGVVELHVRGGWFGRRHHVIGVSNVVDVFPDLRWLVVDAAAVGHGRS